MVAVKLAGTATEELDVNVATSAVNCTSSRAVGIGRTVRFCTLLVVGWLAATLAVDAMGLGVERTGPVAVSLMVVLPTTVDPVVPWLVSVTFTGKVPGLA
jgi:hypothetical protein